MPLRIMFEPPRDDNHPRSSRTSLGRSPGQDVVQVNQIRKFTSRRRPWKSTRSCRGGIHVHDTVHADGRIRSGLPPVQARTIDVLDSRLNLLVTAKVGNNKPAGLGFALVVDDHKAVR